MKTFKKIITLMLVGLCLLACSGCSSEDASIQDGDVKTKFEYLDFKDSATKLEQGVVKAAFLTSGAPTSALTSLATSYSFKIMEIDDEHADKLIANYPFYTKYTIKSGTYSCIDNDVKTVAIMATLVASNSMSEDQIYLLTKALFEQKDNFNHAQASNIDIETAIKGIGNVPMHPGSAKYYAEALGYASVDDFAKDKGIEIAALDGDASDKSTIRFATGGTSGTYYAFGGIIANKINEVTGLNIVPQAANGSGANISDLNAKNVDIAWAQNDVMNYAFNGSDMYETNGAIKGYSAIGAVYPEACQIPANVDINSWDDLNGKTIAIGAVGSGVYFNAVQILSLYGIDVK